MGRNFGQPVLRSPYIDGKKIITARKRGFGKVMFSQMSVCPPGGGISGPMSSPRVGISGTRSLPKGLGMSRGWVVTPWGVGI